MNLDAIALSVLQKELSSFVLGARVDRVYQTSKTAICLHLYNKTTKYLMIDVGNSYICLLDTPAHHLDTPSAFCMLLRKHLEGGRITDLTQYKQDRILMLTISTIGFANELAEKIICIELTGKNSNLILMENDMVMQAIKHIGVRDNSFRQIQPNRPYVLPPQKIHALTVDEAASLPIADWQKLLNGQLETTVPKWLVQNIAGIGSVLAKELALRAEATTSVVTQLTESQIVGLSTAMQELVSALGNNRVFAYSKNGSFNALASLPLLSLLGNQDLVCKEFEYVNEAIIYFNSLHKEQLPKKIVMEKVLAKELSKYDKKLAALQDDYAVAENGEDLKFIADNIMTYLFDIPPNVSVYECIDIYSNNTITIQLDAALNASQNAAWYYKRYNKAKRAVLSVFEQIEKTKEHLEYLHSLSTGLANSVSESELQDITEEMQEIGLLQIPKKKGKQAIKKSAPWSKALDPDTMVYVGKNNLQNEQVTFKIGKPQDLWLHIKNQPGAHVLLKNKDGYFADEHIFMAACLCVYFSKARYSENVAVDYTLRKNVRKPAGAKPGFVLYEKQTTVYISPDLPILEDFIKD